MRKDVIRTLEGILDVDTEQGRVSGILAILLFSKQQQFFSRDAHYDFDHIDGLGMLSPLLLIQYGIGHHPN